MPPFCDLISIGDLWKREQQLSILRAFAGRGWMPPDEDWAPVSIKVEMENLDKIVKLITSKPSGKYAKCIGGGEIRGAGFDP